MHDSLTHSISIVKLQAGVAVHLARKRGEEIPPALLVERARAAGLAAELTVSGPERPLPAAVDRAVYRIVQEALTNAARHAGPAKVGVRLVYGADDVTIRIEDDGNADPSRPPEPGIGLTGMRERVTALHGTLHAAPRAEGGFEVRARLPLEMTG